MEKIKAVLPSGGATGGEPRTWAIVVAGGLGVGPAKAVVPAKVVPARQTREVIIRTREQREDLAKRTPQQVIDAITRTAHKTGAVAARRLRSGDTVVTFNTGTKKEFLKDTNWVGQAFGEGAAIVQRTYAVLAKGVPAHRL